MPWFSRKKKRKQKNAAVNNASRDDAVVTTTSQPAFAVMVQNFESSVSDQISVERGQVVEALFTEDDWVFVRNVNGRCGYIPGNFCFPLEKLRMGLPEESSERVRQLRAHPRPTTIHVDTFDDDPREGEVGEVREGEDEEVNSPDSGISCSHQASSSNMESVHSSLHNTRERLVTRNSSRRVAGDTGAESDRSHTHPIRHPERHKRFLMPNSSLPLLETAPSAGEPDHSPSPPPLQPVNLSQTPGHAHHVATATVTDGDNLQSVSDGDDVFLPEANKPLGIYQCAETYSPQFEGEIPLQRDEVVVVLEAGSGEWVWAMGSEGKEGLVLKSLLHKYRPDVPEEEEEEEEDEIDIGEEVGAPGEEEGVEEIEEAREREEPAVADSEILTSSSATQTELIIDGVVRELSSSVPQRSSGTTASPPAQDTASVSIQTEFTLPNWFKNNTPVPTPNNTLTRTTGTRDDSHTGASSHTAAPDTSSPPPQCHDSHTQHSNASSQPHPSSPHESSAPLKLLCNPRSSNSSSNSSGATARASVENRPRHPNTSVGVRTPRGPCVPLTPASTPPQPSVVLQTPSANNATRTLVSSHDAAAAPAIAGTGDNTTTSQPQSIRPSEPPQPQQQQHAVRDSGTRDEQARPSSRVIPPSNGTGTIQRHRHALLQHTRIVNSIPFEPDNEAATTSHPSSSARRRRMQPTPVATAVRDYSPPQRARNALVLRRGDIMYAQPHVPFPHGWVWVYHTLHKTFGYVPKDHIAYMYLVQKDHGTLLEDVV